MSPNKDNRDASPGPDVSVNIPHDRVEAPPSSAPPLPPMEALPTRPIIIADNPPQSTSSSQTSPSVAPSPTPMAPTPPPPAPAIEEFHERSNHHWLSIGLYTLLALVVAVIVVFAGRWIYRKANHSDTNKPSPVPADTNKLPAQPGSNNSGSSNATNGSNTSTSPSQTVQTGGNLPNNGPGDVIAIFVGTAVLVGGLHFVYSLRKSN